MDIKREVLQAWQQRANQARDKIAERELALTQERYELDIARRVLSKAQNDAQRETWQIQVDVLRMFVGQSESEIAEQQEELELCAAMLAEIGADLAAG
jgi:hypothetical protein